MRIARVFVICLFMSYGCFLSVGASVSYAQESGPTASLDESLRWAYQHNPTLRAARAELKAVQEALPQAMAGWKPSVDASGNISSVKIDGDNFGGEGTTSKEVELSFNQPVWRGGRTFAAMDAAEKTIGAQRALLRSTEQTVLLDAVTAYMDVLRDRALYDLAANNEKVIERNLEATRQRFDVGELTRTDVSQARARLARAKAGRISAMGDLQASKAVYEEIIGRRAPGRLEEPKLAFAFPAALDEAIEYAFQHNPLVQAAQYIHATAEENVDEVFGELLPEMALFGSWNRQFDPQPGLLKESTTRTVGLSASIPLYQAGAVRSRVRQAKHTANRRYIEIIETRRSVRQQVIANWETLEAARAEIESRQAEVRASAVAQEGVQAEAQLGARTVLDTLDAEQEHLDARVALVTTRRDEIVAAYSLAATLGLLTPEVLGLTDLSREFDAHLEDIKWKILGMDVDIGQDKR